MEYKSIDELMKEYRKAAKSFPVCGRDSYILGRMEIAYEMLREEYVRLSKKRKLKLREGMKGVTAAAKKANGLSRACTECDFKNKCTLDFAKVCSKSFIEGFQKGSKWAEKQFKTT